MTEILGKKSPTMFGLDLNVVNTICYLGFWVTGGLMLILAKGNRKAHFHALQSTVVFGFLFGLLFIPYLGQIMAPLVVITAFSLWLLLIMKTYRGELFILPIIGRMIKPPVELH
jgi:uncharacterized membrane protein